MPSARAVCVTLLLWRFVAGAGRLVVLFAAGERRRSGDLAAGFVVTVVDLTAVHILRQIHGPTGRCKLRVAGLAHILDGGDGSHC